MAGILDLFVPREGRFFDMLKELSAKSYSGARIFLQFINDYGSLSYAKRVAAINELHRIEHDCDEITHGIVVELNKTFLTPIDREDIHRLSTLVDDVMDIIYNIGHKMLLYDVKKIPKFMLEMTRTALACAEEVDDLIANLGSRDQINPHLKRIHELEKEADSLRNQALAYLFKNSHSAINVVKFKDLYEWLETVCDKAEDIADVVEGIAIKYA
ncbi:MAG: DUF47 family protein [Nanoarchaeota archaeon]